MEKLAPGPSGLTGSSPGWAGPSAPCLAGSTVEAVTSAQASPSTLHCSLAIEFFFSKEDIAQRFGIADNAAKLPEGLIQRNDGMFVAFEVKNQRFPDVANAVGTFEDTVRLARQNNMEIGRLDFFVSSSYEGFSDASYSVMNGILCFQGNPVTIGGLHVNVIPRVLPVP